MSSPAASPPVAMPHYLVALAARERWSKTEIAFWLALLALYFVLPGRLMFASQILVMGLFALSLDLILGYAGIVTLGHAAFFGLGAYSAGLLTTWGLGEPVTGLLIAGAVAGIFGYITSFLVLRGKDLARLMITLGIGQLLYEVANRATALTGGVDGLQDIAVGKVLGLFSFDLGGKVGYLYVLGVSFLLFVLVRALITSPYGLSLRTIRENQQRALAIGIPIRLRLTNIYTFSAMLAGIAGALLMQTTQFVAIDVFNFQRSADLLIILIIGGAATLYGGFVGAAVFMIAQDQLARINPEYWLFWLGILLIVSTLYLRGGLLGALRRLMQLAQRARKGGPP